jgi:predicted amidohydrolase
MRIAIAQIPVTDTLESNLAVVLRTLEDAADRKADVVLFPETALTGYLGFDRTTLVDLAPVRVHQAIWDIQAACKRLAIACVVGQYFKRCGNWYNNAVAIGKQGELLGSYDKCQLVDSDCYEVAPGDAAAIFMLDGVRCSMAVCHDIRYPEILRQYGAAGVQVHFHLFYGLRERGESARKYQEQYDAHLITRAVENGFFLIGANVAKEEQMVRSQIRDPEGACVVIGESWQPQLLIAEIDERRGGDGWAAKRRDDLFASFAQQRPKSYFERGVWDHKDYMIHFHGMAPEKLPPA